MSTSHRDRSSPWGPITNIERRLHLVDVENLVSTTRVWPRLVRQCRCRYLDVAKPGESDLVVVACSHHVAKVVGFEWPGARLVVRSGQDGADLALLEAWKDLSVDKSSFAEVIIASGDSIFVPLALELARTGVRVTVISRTENLALSLRLAAGTVVTFDERATGPTEILPTWSGRRLVSANVDAGELTAVGGRR